MQEIKNGKIVSFADHESAQNLLIYWGIETEFRHRKKGESEASSKSHSIPGDNMDNSI